MHRTKTYLNILLVEADCVLQARRQAFHGPVDIAKDFEEPAVFQRPTKKTGVLEVVQSNRPVALESEMQEVEVLGDDRVCRAREIERERIFDGAEVVQLEDEVAGKEVLGTPDDPADTDICQSEFVTGGIDRDYARDLEIPLVLRGGEGSDEPSRRGVDVDRDGYTGLGFVFVEKVRHLLHRFVMTGVCA